MVNVDYLSYIEEAPVLLTFLDAFRVLMTLSIDSGGFAESLFSSSLSFTTRAESASPALEELEIIRE